MMSFFFAAEDNRFSRREVFLQHLKNRLHYITFGEQKTAFQPYVVGLFSQKIIFCASCAVKEKMGKRRLCNFFSLFI